MQINRNTLSANVTLHSLHQPSNSRSRRCGHISSEPSAQSMRPSQRWAAATQPPEAWIRHDTSCTSPPAYNPEHRWTTPSITKPLRSLQNLKHLQPSDTAKLKLFTGLLPWKTHPYPPYPEPGHTWIELDTRTIATLRVENHSVGWQRTMYL